MKLYLSAETKTGYTPDWIQIEFQNSEHPQGLTTLTMDIRGTIGYDPDTFNVRVKGELVPWTIVEPDGKETDLSEHSDTDTYIDLFNKYIQKAYSIMVGVAPTDNDLEEINENDTFTNCMGTYDFLNEDDDVDFVSFEFDVEVVQKE